MTDQEESSSGSELAKDAALGVAGAAMLAAVSGPTAAAAAFGCALAQQYINENAGEEPSLEESSSGSELA